MKLESSLRIREKSLKGIGLLTAVLKPNLELNAGLQIVSTVLRVVVGVVRVHNGWDKLSDIENFARVLLT
jgi:putative oxidoreductase